MVNIFLHYFVRNKVFCRLLHSPSIYFQMCNNWRVLAVQKLTKYPICTYSSTQIKTLLFLIIMTCITSLYGTSMAVCFDPILVPDENWEIVQRKSIILLTHTWHITSEVVRWMVHLLAKPAYYLWSWVSLIDQEKNPFSLDDFSWFHLQRVNEH